MSIKSLIRRATSRDDCVYWPPVGTTDFGRGTIGRPIALKCRWEDKQIEFLDEEGKVLVSKAVVTIDTQLEFGGILWHGKERDLISRTNPSANPGALEIRGMSKTPDFKNTAVLQEYML